MFVVRLIVFKKFGCLHKKQGISPPRKSSNERSRLRHNQAGWTEWTDVASFLRSYTDSGDSTHLTSYVRLLEGEAKCKSVLSFQ